MNSQTTTTAARPGCKYPGCGHPAAPAGGTGRPPEYCAGRGHTRVSAWRERRRLAAEQAGTTISPVEDASPLTMAKMTEAELLRSLRAEADRIAALGAGLRDRIDTLADPTAAEAEVEAIRAAAEQRAAAAEARAAAAEQRAAQAEQFRAEADAAAEEMSEHLTTAQARAERAGERAAAAEADRDTAVAQARRTPPRGSPPPRLSGMPRSPRPAPTPRPASALPRLTATRPARPQLTPRPPPGRPGRTPPAPRLASTLPVPRQDGSAPTPTGRWSRSVATPARERDELRADLRGRAERAERQADAYRDELDRLRGITSPGTSDAVKTSRRAVRTQAAQP